MENAGIVYWAYYLSIYIYFRCKLLDVYIPILVSLLQVDGTADKTDMNTNAWYVHKYISCSPIHTTYTKSFLFQHNLKNCF